MTSRWFERLRRGLLLGWLLATAPLLRAETLPFHGFALIAHGGRLSSARQQLIRQLVIEAPAEERARWGEMIRHGAVRADDRDYAAVRALLPAYPIPEKGNF